MKIDDAYLKRIIRESSPNGFSFMCNGNNGYMCRVLSVTPTKLQKLLDAGLRKGLIDFDDKSCPSRIFPTEQGRTFAGLDAEERRCV